MEKLVPEKSWLESYEKVKDILASPTNYADLFELNDIRGHKLCVVEMGEVTFPTGEVLACDPLTGLQRDKQPYLQSVPVGTYKIETLAIEVDKNAYRYLLTRVKLTAEKPLIYHQALVGTEHLKDIEEGDFFGFGVDAGLATIIDVQTKHAYCDFEESWYQQNPDKNIYDDYFAELFKKNAQQHPLCQREQGDWINFRIPNTELNVPMIQSGFGDGVYPVYFGYDKNNNICDIVLEYIDAEEL